MRTFEEWIGALKGIHIKWLDSVCWRKRGRLGSRTLGSRCEGRITSAPGNPIPWLSLRRFIQYTDFYTSTLTHLGPALAALISHGRSSPLAHSAYYVARNRFSRVSARTSRNFPTSVGEIKRLAAIAASNYLHPNNCFETANFDSVFTYNRILIFISRTKSKSKLRSELKSLIQYFESKVVLNLLNLIRASHADWKSSNMPRSFNKEKKT